MNDLVDTSRRLRDLPKDEEDSFCPNTFVPRQFLINTKNGVREDIKPLILSPPDNVAGYESDGYFRRAVTWKIFMERRRERQKKRLEDKRSCWDFVRKIPLFIWVFHCPGISGIYEGTWLYFKGREKYYGGGFKGSIGCELLDRVIALFPLVEKDLFGNYDFELWKSLFIKKYKKGCWAGRPQGLTPVWTLVRGGQVLEITDKIQVKSD